MRLQFAMGYPDLMELHADIWFILRIAITLLGYKK